VVFTSKWEAAIPVMIALSLGMASRLVIGPAESLLLAQRRVRAYMMLSIGYAAVFLTLVGLLAGTWGEDNPAVGAAIGGAICLTALGPVAMWLAIGRGSGAAARIAHIYSAPVAASIAAFAPAVLIVDALGGTLRGDVLAIFLVAVLGSAAYAGLISLLAPGDWRELAGRFAGIGARLKRRPPADSLSVS
jgi:O-antigen/teichoic acid export membrane protein